MNSTAMYEQLDLAVEKILSGEAVMPEEFDPLVAELMPIAEDLGLLPRAEFRANLAVKLAISHGGEVISIRRAEDPILPSLFGTDGSYGVRKSNFAVSAALHAAALLLIATSSLWLSHHEQKVRLQTTSLVTDISPYLPSSSGVNSGGGGGGGDRDKLAASKGDAPRFAREQITPPAIVVRNNDPKLQVDPTVVGPPDITLSKLGNTGDPLTGILGPASNGTGSGGGIGNGAGGGVGPGRGPGVGAGVGGGYGGGIYTLGNGVSAPRAIYDPEPQYSEEARKAKFQGAVILAIIVGADGRAHDVKIARSLGMGLDEKAIEAVKQWRFLPAMKDGQPVSVLVNVEVDFRVF
jgi:TonB family protein